MATRFYLDSTATPDISPGFDGSWTSNTGAVRRVCKTVKGSSAMTTSATLNVTSGANNNALCVQFISAALAAQTISGTVSAIAMARELANTDNINRPYLSIRVVQSDGTTIRGTILTLGNQTGAYNTELTTTLSTATFANGATLTSLAVSAGDRLVIEMGYGMSATGTSPQYAMRWGESAAGDGTIGTNNSTTDINGFVEFSANLTFAGQTYEQTLSDTSETVTESLVETASFARTMGDTSEATTDSLTGATSYARSNSDAESVTDSLTAGLVGQNVPQDLFGSNLKHWYLEQYATGTWTDEQGNANATQGTAGFRPTTITKNGHTVLEFDGTDDVLSAGDITALDSSFTVFGVFRADAGTSQINLLGKSGFTVYVDPTTNVDALTVADPGAGGDTAWGHDVRTSTRAAWHVFVYTYNASGGTNASTGTLYLNSATASANTLTGGDPLGNTGDAFMLGDTSDLAVNEQFWDGALGNVGIVDRVATAGEIASLVQYLQEWIGHAATLSDAVSTTDAISAGLVYAASLSDAVSVTDALSAGFEAARTISDTATLTETLSQTASYGSTASDTATTTDGATQAVTYARTATDGAETVTDALAQTATYARGSAGGGGDIAGTLGSRLYAWYKDYTLGNWDDADGGTDATQGTGSLQPAVQTTTGGQSYPDFDGSDRLLGGQITALPTHSAGYHYIFGALIRVDVSGLQWIFGTDSTNQYVNGSDKLQFAGAESNAAVNDGVWRRVIVTKNGSSGTVTMYIDGVAQTTTSTEAFGSDWRSSAQPWFGDRPGGGYPLNGAIASLFLGCDTTTAFSGTDVANLDADLQAILEGGTGADEIAATDALARTASFASSLSDTATVTEALTQTASYSSTGSDTATATDGSTQTVTYARTASDTESVTDDLTYEKTGGQLYSQTLSDTVDVTDTQAQAVWYARSSSDAETVTDALTRTASYGSTASDTATTSDAGTTSTVYARSAADVEAVTDAFQATPTFGRTFADALVISDAGSTFDPATLSLSGWWRNYGGSSPWVGTSSAGTSSANDATEATNPPAAGAALSGYGVADFDGTNDLLTVDGTFSDYFTNGAGSGWILFKVDAVNDLGANPWNGDVLLSTQVGFFFGIFLRETGPTVGVNVFNFDHENVSTSFSLSTWTLAQWKWDGSSLKIRANDGAWQSISNGGVNASANTSPIAMARNAIEIISTAADVAEVAFAGAALSDGTFDDVYGYVQSRYLGATLGAKTSVVYERTFADTATVAEALSQVAWYDRPLVDTVAISDAVDGNLAGTFSATFTESIEVIEALTTATAYARASSDAEAVTEQLGQSATFARAGADTATVTEAFTRTAEFGGNASDTATTTDTTASTAVYARQPSDALDAVDVAVLALAYARAALDALDAADTLTATTSAAIQRTESDTVATTDATSTEAVFARAVGDAENAVDVCSVAFDGSRTVLDIAATDDTVGTAVAYARTEADAIALAEGLTAGLVNPSRAVLETTVAALTTFLTRVGALTDFSTSVDAHTTFLTRVSPMKLYVGAVAKIRTTLVVDNVGADPSSLTITVVSPLGTRTVYTYGVSANVVREDTGKYRAEIDCTEPGTWAYKWLSPGPNAEGSDEGTFFVETPVL